MFTGWSRKLNIFSIHSFLQANCKHENLNRKIKICIYIKEISL